MATRSCTYNGMANFNGGWSPSSGYSKTLDGYIGDGGGYGVALKFAVPSAPGAAAGRSLTIALDLMTLGYRSGHADSARHVGRERAQHGELVAQDL